MKLRWQKLLLVKPKSAIGVSMLDVISNALASIILLFFILVGLRSLPPPPERVLGILVVDYELRWQPGEGGGTVVRRPEMEVYLRGPDINGLGLPQPRFGPQIEETLGDDAFRTEGVSGIKGIWPGAKVLEARGRDYVRKRVYYFNPQCPPSSTGKQVDCKWSAGAIYVEDSSFFDSDFPQLAGASMSVQAWFLKGGTEEHLKRDTIMPIPTRFPSHVSVDLEFTIPTYQSVSVAN